MKNEKEFWFRENRFGGIYPVHWKAFALFGALAAFVISFGLAISATGVFKDPFWVFGIPALIAFFVGIGVSAAHTGPRTPPSDG